METPIMFQIICKKCGGEVLFNAQEGGRICKQCKQSLEISEMDVKEINYSKTCPNCGAALRGNAAGDTMICDHCSNAFFLRKDKYMYDEICPLMISSVDDAKNIMYKILEKEHAPKNFRSKAIIREVTPIFLPFYVINLDYNVSYTLEFGIEEQRRVYNNSTKKYETQTLTTWVPQNGILNGTVDINISGFRSENLPIRNKKVLTERTNVNQMTKLAGLIVSSLPFARAAKYNPLLLFGADVTIPDEIQNAWNENGEKQFSKLITNRISSLHPQKTRNINYSGSKNINTVIDRLFPVWLAIYDYNNKEYMLAFDGINGDIYRGSVPLSALRFWGKFAKWALTFGSVALSLLLDIILYNSSKNVQDSTAFFLALLMFVFPICGIIFAVGIFKAFKKRRF